MTCLPLPRIPTFTLVPSQDLDEIRGVSQPIVVDPKSQAGGALPPPPPLPTLPASLRFPAATLMLLLQVCCCC